MKASWTEQNLHGYACIHPVFNTRTGEREPCGEFVDRDKPNGWLCRKHDHTVFGSKSAAPREPVAVER